jgi:flagellar L-ring protein precursor FlgH
MVMQSFRVLLAIKLLLLGGCAGGSSFLAEDKAWMASLPPVVPPQPLANGTIYQVGQDMRLFEDSVSRRVGDILTIKLVEVTSAQKSSSTSASKDSSIDIAAPTIAGRGVPRGASPFGETAVSGGTSFGGSGSSAQSNSLVGDITVTVAQRWPNGNMLVRGEKWITINQGREFVRVSGIVRAADINPDNTVLSSRVADARIIYSSRGVLADANKPGLLTRFFNLPFMPL